MVVLDLKRSCLFKTKKGGNIDEGVPTLVAQAVTIIAWTCVWNLVVAFFILASKNSQTTTQATR